MATLDITQLALVDLENKVAQLTREKAALESREATVQKDIAFKVAEIDNINEEIASRT